VTPAVRRRANVVQAAPIFAALGDPTRLALIARLGSMGPQSITSLSEGSTVTRQAITKHLTVLDDAGLVRSVRLGRERIWEFDATRIADARRFLDEVSSQWDIAIGRLKHYVEK
jgi:DNA-binding transcriptional ArsR family regulator